MIAPPFGIGDGGAYLFAIFVIKGDAIRHVSIAIISNDSRVCHLKRRQQFVALRFGLV
jgi:hypothetical protein